MSCFLGWRFSGTFFGARDLKGLARLRRPARSNAHTVAIRSSLKFVATIGYKCPLLEVYLEEDVAKLELIVKSAEIEIDSSDLRGFQCKW